MNMQKAQSERAVPISKKLGHFLLKNNTYLVFLALFIVCSLASDVFLTPVNLRNILLQQAAPILVAVGMLMVILSGGIDLSIGSVMAIGSSLAGILIVQAGIPWPIAIGIAILIGTLFGALTGTLVAYLNFQGFVASLAVMTIARGVAFTITNATPITLPGGSLQTLVSRDYAYPIILITLVVVIVFAVITNFTSYGRIVIATGSNPEAVKLSGIRHRQTERANRLPAQTDLPAQGGV